VQKPLKMLIFRASKGETGPGSWEIMAQANVSLGETEDTMAHSVLVAVNTQHSTFNFSTWCNGFHGLSDVGR
jgi:hypothetical protein